jgi:hypothetical protein
MRTLRPKKARCANVLILPRFSSVRPAARCGFYPAVTRSAICSPPILRRPSPTYDQTKIETKRARADSAQVCCRRHDESLVICTRVMFAKPAEVRTHELRWLCAFACRSDARERQADGSGCDMVTSGIVQSGHQSRHDNINAIDPKQPLDVINSKPCFVRRGWLIARRPSGACRERVCGNSL